MNMISDIDEIVKVLILQSKSEKNMAITNTVDIITNGCTSNDFINKMIKEKIGFQLIKQSIVRLNKTNMKTIIEYISFICKNEISIEHILFINYLFVTDIRTDIKSLLFKALEYDIMTFLYNGGVIIIENIIKYVKCNYVHTKLLNIFKNNIEWILSNEDGINCISTLYSYTNYKSDILNITLKNIHCFPNVDMVCRCLHYGFTDDKLLVYIIYNCDEIKNNYNKIIVLDILLSYLNVYTLSTDINYQLLLHIFYNTFSLGNLSIQDCELHNYKLNTMYNCTVILLNKKLFSNKTLMCLNS